MSVTFTVDEMLAMAERIEQNGVTFYRGAATQVSDDKMKETLNWLADQEEQHEKIFAGMRTELRGRDIGDPVWDPDNEYEMYVRALADGKVFDLSGDAAGTIKGFDTVREILEFALDREKDSIVFYMVINRVAPGGMNKERIQGILDEEIGHVALITNKLAAM